MSRLNMSGLALALGTVLPHLSCALTAPRPFDVIIEGGTVIDGTGAPGRVTDIGIDGARITAIGDLEGEPAARRIDAAGLVVAPGFIDVHNHSERDIDEPEYKTNEGFVTQGVTTCVHGVDGNKSPAQIAALRETFTTQGVGTNYAFYVGHNAIRAEVMGNEERAPTDDELEQMKQLVDEGMALGAFGLSDALMYPPGSYADAAEVTALAEVAAAQGGAYDSHIRDPVGTLVDSVRECIEIGEAAGARPHPAHHKAVGKQNWGKADELASVIQEARDRGVDVTVDQYPYDGAATAPLIDVPLRPPTLELDTPEALLAALDDRFTYEQIKDATENGLPGAFSWIETVGYDSLRVVVSEQHPELVGALVSEAAAERGVEPFAFIVWLLHEEPEGVLVTLGACAEEDVRDILTRPWTMVASDGAARSSHPRSRGTFPRVLGRYVREWGLLSLEQAVHKMTGMPAAFLRLSDRGVIGEGAYADITVFDPDTIVDHATWAEPWLLSTGVEYVLVNGELALDGGAMTGSTSGRFVGRPAS